MVSENVVVKATKAGRIKAAVSAGFIGALVGILLGVVVFSMWLKLPEASVFGYTLMLMVGATAVGAALGYRDSGQVAVVTPHALELYNGQKLWQSFPRDRTRFSSKVTKHYTNGIRSGISRRLVVENEAGSAEYGLVGFGKTEFSDLLNALNPISGESGLVNPQMRNTPVPTYTYHVHANSIRSQITLAAVGYTIGLGGLLGLIAALMMIPNMPISAMIIVVAPALIVVALIVWVWQRRARLAERVPGSFTVSSAGIAVDQVAFDPAYIQRIMVTPPAYTLDKASVRIATPEGTKVYNLGNARSLKTVFPEYESFLIHLSHATIERPGLVQLDLT